MFHVKHNASTYPTVMENVKLMNDKMSIQIDNEKYFHYLLAVNICIVKT